MDTSERLCVILGAKIIKNFDIRKKNADKNKIFIEKRPFFSIFAIIWGHMHRPVLRKRMVFHFIASGWISILCDNQVPSCQHHAPLLIPNASILNPQSFFLNPSQFSVLTKSHHITQENTKRKSTNLRKNNIFS